MYQIYFDGAPLYDPRMEELALREASVHLAVNEAGSLSLVLDSAHPAYGRITRKKGVLELFSDGQTLFRGRVLSDTRDFYNARTVEAEGLLACLNDSAIPPHAFPDDWLKDSAYQSAAAEGNVVAFYLGWLMDTHNAQVEEWQQIHLGSVTVTDPNNYITRSCESWATAWDTVSDKLFGSALGGYLLVRYTQNGTFVDYVDELPLTNTQAIQFGENLLDLTDETDAADTYTAILPVGADGLTLRDLPDGAVNGDLVKEGYIIYSTSGRAKYGNITRIVTWNEVTLADNLRSKAAAELAQAGVKLVETITATAVDLGLTDAEVAQLRVGRNTVVRSAPHGLTAAYPLTTLDLDLLRPEQTQIVLGASVASLSGRTQAAVKEAAQTAGLALARVEAEYYLSTSKTALSGGSWSTAAPAWEDGKYMWSRTKTTSASGTVSYSDPVCIAGAKGDTGATGAQGPKGDTGATGADGRGIQSTAVTYQASTSGTTVPAGTWSASIPAVAAGSYLWTRTVITYTDSTTSTSYSVAKMGNTGAAGATGATGKGIESIVEQYYLSTSGTTLAGGSWSDTSPAYAAGMYIWTRSYITWSDGTTSTTDPVLAQALNSLGENLENTQQQVNSIYAETSAQVTQVVQNSQEIIFEALEEYARTSDLTQLQETLSAQLAVMSDNVTINVSSITQRLENMEGDLQAQIDVISKVFRFAADGFYIGDPNSEILLKQSNDRVSFIDGGLEIAWWANKEFHTSDIAVDSSITISPFILCRRETANGTHLTLKVGG